MKFIMVPPGVSERLLAVLRAQSDTQELPAIAGMLLIVSRHCPPDTGYILQAEPIPKVEPCWEGDGRSYWNIEEPEPDRSAYKFSIDYGPTIIEYRPRPPARPRPRWERWLLGPVGSRRDRVATRLYIWRLRFRWWTYPVRTRLRELWWQMKWESRSPFRDGDEFDPF